MRIFVLYFIIYFLNIGCSLLGGIRPELDSDLNYQKDLDMEVTLWDGLEWNEKFYIKGVGVVPKAEGYKILVKPPGKADMITALSCHREWKTPNPEKKGGWFSKKQYEFEIWPTEEHEIKKTCPFDMGVYEKDKGRHSWGLIVIDSYRENMGATVKCNGSTDIYMGSSVCQAKKGLIQSVHFLTEVKATKVIGCELRQPNDKKNWVYLMPEGECTIFFVDIKDPDNIHKMVTFGYGVIPIRGIE